MVKLLDNYVKCEGCGLVLVIRVYAGHKYKPLCVACRGRKVKSRNSQKVKGGKK